MNETNEKQDSVIDRIVDGSLEISSLKEYENLLAIFPDEPNLYRYYGDLLASRKDMDHASKAYNKASGLFANNGMTLQAIVARILEWSLNKPSHTEGKKFHSSIRDDQFQETPLQSFFAGMSYPELITIMLRMVRVRVPAGKFIIKQGDPGIELFFVVSGKLKEIIYEIKNQDSDSTFINHLIANDIFGEIYPFEKEIKSSSDVIALTRVELVKITKPVLKAVCHKYPKIEFLIGSLFNSPIDKSKKRSWRKVRKSRRHELPTQVKLIIFKNSPQNDRLEIGGLTKDLSVGGACIDIGVKTWAGAAEDLAGKSVKLIINLPNYQKELNILGNIKWSRTVKQDQIENIIIGIQFKDMPNHEIEALNLYCNGSQAEQNLLWSLWDSLVKK